MELVIDDQENMVSVPESESNFEPDYLFDTLEPEDE